jgi:hypothetical protein
MPKAQARVAVAALATLSLAQAFAPPFAGSAGCARRLPGAPRVDGGLPQRLRARVTPTRAALLRLRAADLSLAVSDTPPEEDPLAGIPAVKVHTAEGAPRAAPRLLRSARPSLRLSVQPHRPARLPRRR